MLTEFKPGDIIHDGLLGYWIFISHNDRLCLYPLEYYNDGKLSEKENTGQHCCSFIHELNTWRNLENQKILGNYNQGFKPSPKGIFVEIENAYKKGKSGFNKKVNGSNKTRD